MKREPSLEELIEMVREHVWTEDDKREFAISFAFGNCKLDGCNVTIEGVREAYNKLHPEPEAPG